MHSLRRKGLREKNIQGRNSQGGLKEPWGYTITKSQGGDFIQKVHLSGVCWASWICKLMFLIKFDKFSVIFSKFFQSCFYSPPLVKVHCTDIGHTCCPTALCSPAWSVFMFNDSFLLPSWLCYWASPVNFYFSFLIENMHLVFASLFHLTKNFYLLIHCCHIFL